MKLLSTGAFSTLGSYRELCVFFYGENSAATNYIDQKIAEAPNGGDEEVVIDERQMASYLNALHLKDVIL